MSKTGGSLKLFDQQKVAAAQPYMEAEAPQAPAAISPPVAPITAPTSARNRKAGGRNVRISGYVPVEIADALRDEVIRRMNETRQTVSVNDVLCAVLGAWVASRKAAP
jgi:hypothetical protein